MPDVCDQPILISPELATVFRKHFNSIYQISWFQPIIVRYKSRKASIEAIRQRYEEICNANIARFADNIPYVEGQKRMLAGAREFCADMKTLSHNDIDLIRRMTPYEALGVMSDNKRKIETINGKPIKLEA